MWQPTGSVDSEAQVVDGDDAQYYHRQGDYHTLPSTFLTRLGFCNGIGVSHEQEEESMEVTFGLDRLDIYFESTFILIPLVITLLIVATAVRPTS